MKIMPMTAVARSDRGRVREVNEDSVAVLDQHGLVVLADGMGGYNAGEVASQLAVETITTSLLPLYNGDSVVFSDEVLESVVEDANEAILCAVEENPDYKGMATTVVVALFGDRQVHFGHVGDSRLYRLRNGCLQQMTRDHSMVQALVDEGMFASIQEALDAGVKNNVLFRGLGIADTVEVELGCSELVAGDLYLACSDGLSNMLTDREMERILLESPDELEMAADRLLTAALESGGLDNVSLALACPQS
ncbi:MAG: protein phosphatase 2C domain-containing protein [Sedimenticola sp.]|nr:protein phosphatase 2C domain-containing protein [Sedimenticola sp.]